MHKFFPFLDWIKTYNKKQFGGDLSAGLTVGVMLIPQGMAYSMLAGLPPQYGLYASIVPLIVYAILGTSRQLAVGPVAMVALLIASGVGALTEIGSESFIGLAILLSLMVGAIQLLMGLLRLGFIVNFLSHPVIAGFTSAAALIIGLSQLKHLLGINIPRGKVHETLYNVYLNFESINVTTFAIGASAILVIIFLKKVSRKIPAPLVVVLLGIMVVSIFGLDENGVAIVKEIPAGLPSFSLESFNFDNLSDLLPIALTISLIGFMESIAVAKAIQSKHKNYEIVANQELIALGAANIFGGLFQAFPTTGGFSRTAVNDQAGAKTGMAAVISAGLIVLTLLFLTQYFFYMPKAILAAIIMVAVAGLIDIKEAKHLWKTDKTDFWMFMSTAAVTLIFGVEEGIGAGVVLSLGMVIYRVSYPHMAVMGQIPGTTRYRNIKRYDNLIKHEGILIVRLDAQLYFANSEYFKDNLLKLAAKSKDLKAVIIDTKAVNHVDSSALHMLQNLAADFKARGVRMILSGVVGPVRDSLAKAHIVDDLGEENFFLHVHEAVEHLTLDKESAHKDVILQSND